MFCTLLAYSSLLFYYITVPSVEMREEPDSHSAVDSQAYFSERIIPLEDKGDWVKIKTTVDNYEGWAKKNTFCERSDAYLANPSTTVAKVNRCAAHLYSEEDTERGPILTLPFESLLAVVEEIQTSNKRWIKVSLPDGKEGYIQRGDVTLNPTFINRDQMCQLSSFFLNLPYTWAGRSSFGYDCSGYTQMLYRQMGIFIPRNSKNQINWSGFTNVALENLQPGDLIFFGANENKISHVGMSLGNGQFIHTTVADNMPYTRISQLTEPTWNGSGRFAYRAGRTLKN